MSGKKHRGRSVIGLETEYGCLVTPHADTSKTVRSIRDWLFEQHRYGLLDVHDRDWDEPAGNGGFLFNGGRVYLDMGHVEYCTPECATVADVVRYDRAGDRILLKAVEALELGGRVNFFRNNIDHFSGATFGCHENYSLRRDAPFTEANILSLLAFLTLRVLYTGAGRVGGRADPDGFTMAATPEEYDGFQLSQRADFIQNDFYEWVQRSRAIINTRDEPLADPRYFRRLHLLHGDTNVLPAALFLKAGSTRLVLDLVEANDLPPIVLADAVSTLRALSRQTTGPWRVPLANGKTADAVELIDRYRQRAEKRFRGLDQDTDGILDLWRRVTDGLASSMDDLIGVVDWISKRHLLDAFRQSENLQWSDPWLKAQDLEYHHVDPIRSLGLAVADTDGPWTAGVDDDSADLTAPTGTRAGPRSRAMREAIASGEPYEIDWDSVKVGGLEVLTLPNPLTTAE